jgi:RIO-like serine/threonine protein kinase
MFETDTKVERDGVIIEYAPGVEIRIARAGGSNKYFSKVMQRLAKPHRRAIQTDSVDEDVLKNIFIKAYAQAIVVDWKGFTKDLITHDDADAETDLEFNQDNVEAVLQAQPNLFTDIQKASDNISYFRAEINEADSGN